MKLIYATLLLLCCSFAVNAQSNPGGVNGSSNGNGNAYSNGNIPSPYEQNQNRPDSTLRSSDTTYQKQQWNDGASQDQKPNTNKRSKTTSKSTPKKATTTK